MNEAAPTGRRGLAPSSLPPVGWGKKIKEAVWGAASFFTLYAPSGQGCRGMGWPLSLVLIRQ
jgi:hypothetical protein